MAPVGVGGKLCKCIYVVVVVEFFTWGVWGHVANDPALQRAYIPVANLMWIC